MSGRSWLHVLPLVVLAAFRASPSHAEPSCAAQHLFAGRAAVCAIRQDGQASCWGDYFESLDTYFLIHRHGDGEFLEISVGYDRVCGIRTDHTVTCWWGYNEQSLADSLPAPEGEFSHLSLSIDHDDGNSCGLRPDGTLVCWDNDDPSITTTPADGTFVDFSGSCGLRPDGTVDCIDGWTPPEGTFASLATASYPACGLRENGEISCWLETGESTESWINGPSAGSYKQVSIHSDDPRGGCAITMEDELSCWGGLKPPFTPKEGKFAEVVAGGRKPCAIRADGSINCWAGTVTTFNSALAPVVGSFAHVSAGGDPARRQSTCAVRTSGLVTCWGNTEYLQTFPPAKPFASVSAAAYHTCGLRTDGTIACWGMDSASLAVPDGEFAQVTAGGLGACGLRSNGQVECWSYAEGLAIDAPVGSFESVALSGYGLTLETFHHLGCGIRSDKTLECWGDAEYGLLDPPGGEFTSVSPGGEKACALRSDGEVVCWGRYHDVDPLSIFKVPPGPFVEVACGYYHTCGVRPDGTVECWGLDQLQSLCSLPTTCGNGTSEPGEYCDDGDEFAPGQGCNAKCFPTPCGQPVNAEAFEPRVSDALFVLQSSLELRSCDSHICDVNVDDTVDVSDALLVLQKAVGQPVTLRCSRSIAVGVLITPWEPCPFPFPLLCH